MLIQHTEHLPSGLDGSSRIMIPLPKRPRFLRGPRLETPVRAVELRTPRLRLRPHRRDEAIAWHRLQSNPEILRYLSWPLRDYKSSEQHLHDRTRHTVLWQSGDFLALAVELDGELIGDVSLHLRSVSATSRTAEIGWIIDPRFGRHGYGTEAAQALLAFAFGVLGAKIIVAVICNENAASFALARRLDFCSAAHTPLSMTLVLTANAFNPSPVAA